MDKGKHMDKALAWVRKNGFTEIKSVQEGFEQPFFYERSSDQHKFTPDITGKSYSKKCYFEICLKNDSDPEALSKITLLNEIARMKGTRLYLMAPAGHLKHTKDVIEANRLSHTEMIRI